jgi:tRNA-binding protein
MVDSPFDATVRVAEVQDAEPFPEARNPELLRVWLDTGDESRQSAAQLAITTPPRNSPKRRCSVSATHP